MKLLTASAFSSGILLAALLTARGGFQNVSSPNQGVTPSLPMSQLSAGRGGQNLAATPYLTDAQCEAGFALVRVTTNFMSWMSMPSNAVVHAPWIRYGVADDLFWLPATNWAFKLGTNAVDGVYVSSRGKLTFGGPEGVSDASDEVGRAMPSVLSPLQTSIGLVPPRSKFWYAPTVSNSMLFTWQDVFVARDTNSPVSFQVELFRNGDFIYRYALSGQVGLSAFTNFVVAAQHNGGGEGYAYNSVDKLSNGLELRWRAFGWLSPGVYDHDRDGLSSYDEVMALDTDPRMRDSDMDGLPDPDELLMGTLTFARDSDGDGLLDGWETAHGLDPLNPADALQDPDADGLSTAYEVTVSRTDPFLLDTDGDGLDDGLESNKQYALLFGGSAQSTQVTWAEPSAGVGRQQALAVGATKWDRTVLFKDGTAVQWRFDEGSYIAMQGVASIACSAYQTLFVDPQGGAIGQYYDPPKNNPFQYYEGRFGAFPQQIAAGGTFAMALLPNGTITNIGAFADSAGNSTTTANPPTPTPTLTSIIPSAYAGRFVSFVTPAATPALTSVPQQIAAGKYASLSLGQNEKVEMWGRSYQNILAVPADLSNVVKITAGAYHSAALLRNGTVRLWGFNLYGQMNVPDGLSNVIDIACSDFATIALRSDGSLSSWGALNNHPQTTYVPASVSNAASVYANGKAGWALSTSGAVIGWGDYSFSFSPLPWKVVSAAFADGSVYNGCRGVALVRLATDPLNADSDGDGMADGLEFAQSTDPRVSNGRIDVDMNGMPDAWEMLQFGSAGQDPSADPDGDGIPNQAEGQLGGDPLFSVQVATAAHGWNSLAWNSFPGASSYSITVWSGGQAITTLVTTATSATLTGRLPAAACSATVSAMDSSGQRIRTVTESWEQPPAGSGITAWKLVGAFVVNRPENSAYTNLLSRTLIINKAADWDELFLSSSSAAAGGWSLVGASIAWTSQEPSSVATASPGDDSLRLENSVSDAQTLGIRLTVFPGKGVSSCATPLYLLRWSPTLAWTKPTDTNSQAYVIVTENRATIASGGLPLVLPDILVSYAGYPYRADIPPPKTLPLSLSCPSASVTSATITVTAPGVVPGPVICPGEPGEADLVFGSARVPTPAPSGNAAPPGNGQEVVDSPGLDLKVRCVGHTVQRYWFDEDHVGSGRNGCCGFPYSGFCKWDNLCGSGYANDVSDHLSSHFRIQVVGSEEVESQSPNEERTQEGELLPLVAFNGEDAISYTLKWKNGAILSGEACPARLTDGSETCTNAVESCSEKGRDCACNSGGCGDEGPSCGSARFLLKLGNSSARASDGALYFDTATPKIARTNLMLLNDGSALVERDAGGITRVTTSLRCVDVADISGGFRLTVNSSLSGENRIWEITNPDPNNLNRALFVKNPGGAEERFELVESANGWWRVDEYDGNGAVRRVKAKRTLHDLFGTVEEMTLQSGANDPGAPFAGLRRLSHLRTVYGDINGYRRKLREEVWNGVADVFETNSFAYVDAPGNKLLNGKIQLATRPDGSWEHSVYDAFGRVTHRSVPRESGIPSPVAPASFDAFSCAGVQVTVSTYPENYDSALVPDQARETAEYAVTTNGSVLISHAWADYEKVSLTVGGLAGVSCLRSTTIRAHAPSALKSDPLNLMTISVSCGPHREDWRRGLAVFKRAEDGLETRFRYEEGNYDSGSATFTPFSGGGYVRSVSAVLPPSGTALPENKMTATISVTDARWGHVLLTETRLLAGGDFSGDPSSWPLLTWSRHVYDGNRLVRTEYSDGTFELQNWNCCRVDSSMARDGSTVQSDVVVANGRSLVSEMSLAALPGSGGRFPATETWSDALDRETNSVRAVWFNGSRDTAYSSLVTRTEYPYGTDQYRVMVDSLGIETITRRYFGKGGEIEETVVAGVTSRVSRLPGGAVVSEKFWHDSMTGVPMWSRETRTVSIRPDGCRAETAVSEASDNSGKVVTTETLYDFLGRVYVSVTPITVRTNYYVNGRLARVSQNGTPDTLYVYDVLGNIAETVVDSDGDGCVTYAGNDRITRTGTVYERSGTDWYLVNSSKTWNSDGLDTPLFVSATRVRMTGLGAAAPAALSTAAILTAQTETVDGYGGKTVTYTYTDASSARVWQVTDTPDSLQDAVQVSIGGHVVSAQLPTAVTTTYAYDGFARQTLAETLSSSGARRVALSTRYNVFGQIEYTEDAASNRTSFAYDAWGRQCLMVRHAPSCVGGGSCAPSCLATHTAYDAEGRVLAAWGATWPVAYEYDTQGRLIAMATTRDPAFATSNLLSLVSGRTLSDRPDWSDRSDPSRIPIDVTRWRYDAATGLLTNKVYADGTGPSFTYTPSGRLATRTWARGVTTSYTYDRFGQLVLVNYSDSTPDVAYAYDRLGRNTSAQTVMPATGALVSSVSNAYAGLNLVAETQNGTQLVRAYDGVGRPWYVCTADYTYECGYGYDAVGRVAEVTSLIGSERRAFQYAYVQGADLIRSVAGVNSLENGSPASAELGRTFDYEPNRDLVMAVSNRWNGEQVSSFSYSTDAFGRRVNRLDLQGGMVSTNGFCYDERSEVTGATMGTHVYSYDYDPIGNRLQTFADGAGTAYLANSLNQYTNVHAAAYRLQPVYDADGNMISNGDWHYVWDAENRLVVASNATTCVRNTYDHQSRRIRKEVFAMASGSSIQMSDSSFVYDGWNTISEKIAHARTNELTNFYVWGLDLSGSLQGSGGVGGLLSVSDVNLEHGTSHTVFPAYDANGNVTAYFDATGSTIAAFTYDAFGGLIQESSSGNISAFLFSTKYFDAETGLYYYGHRYYSPSLGRWPSRDPIGESCACNIYCYVSNAAISFLDILGLWGTAVHNGMTVLWAGYEEYSIRSAKLVGRNNEVVDRPPTGWLPLPGLGDQSYHFNTSGGTGDNDSRLVHKRERLQKARSACNIATDNYKQAAEHLGFSLHALQDWWAHADHNAGGLSFGVHNTPYGPISPDARPGDLPGDYPDAVYLDAKDAPDGRATGKYIIGNNGVAHYIAGIKRIQNTGDQSRQLLKEFIDFVREEGGCKCQVFFLENQ